MYMETVEGKVRLLSNQSCGAFLCGAGGPA